ncbi:hypothetical protein GGD55_003645 [Rhizobium giardinii]|uniref:Uncharacterized protein n=1 Tax=Rhizobium giardinii TaxID=56731 RepID=A0A7W8X840_9HYPH|nr:hypothetical protein [Rhizobium giardinii]
MLAITAAQVRAAALSRVNDSNLNSVISRSTAMPTISA